MPTDTKHSIDWWRNHYEAFHGKSDDEIQEILDALEDLAFLLYEEFQKGGQV